MHAKPLPVALPILVVLLTHASTWADDVPVANGVFDQGASDTGVPIGWRLYAGGAAGQNLSIVSIGEGRHALLLEDGSKTGELGVQQDVPAHGGLAYRLTVKARRVDDAPAAGAYVQLRFLPTDTYLQKPLVAGDAEGAGEVVLEGRAPADATSLRIYLYTHKAETPKVMVESVTLQSGVELPEEVVPAVPPTYDRLKDLHIETPLVDGGKATASIVVSASGSQDAAAREIADAVLRTTGVQVPIIADDGPGAAVPLVGNVIVLGDRTTNRCMNALYDGFYSLIDPKYPGRGGHALRSVHNPYGNGYNAILVGGSDPAGGADAAHLLAQKILETPVADGRLALGFLMETKLGEGLSAPRDVTKAEIWEASRGYGSSGYFGWNSISKRMALYYMTGDESHAREVIRLAFPDAQALAEIDKIDQEMIEDKNHPLSGPYHYSAHFSVLFWDLIEESPVFTDEERLKVTNALAMQLNHRKVEGVYGMTTHKGFVGDRHGDWSAVSLYCLGRYFEKDYPAPVWGCALRSVKAYFSALKESAWLAGSNDHLFWYNSYYEPIETYMLLSGDRSGMESGYLQQALKTQDVLYTGRVPDWALNTASLAWLNKTAYLTGDARWLYYRDRTGLDTNVLRLGQSFWPSADFAPRPPTELMGKWTIQPMPEPMWKGRRTGLPLVQSFLWGSYRTRPDETGDFLLIDGFNGGGRNPYHTFAILEMRLAGVTALREYHNQVLTSADGMVEPEVAMDCALREAAVVGKTAFAVADVPKTPFCNWRRTVAMREGQYTLLCDRLDFRRTTDNMQVTTTWEPVGGAWDGKGGFLRINGDYSGGPPPGWLRFRALEAAYVSNPPGAEHTSNLTSIGIVLLKSYEAGNWLQMPFTLQQSVSGEVYAELVNYLDRGPVRIWLDGEVAVERYEHNTASVVASRVSLGERDLAAGDHTLRVETLGRQEGVDRCFVGLAGVSIRPKDAPAAGQRPLVELHPAQVVPTSGGGVVSMEWVGPVREGEHKTNLYLLGARQPDDPRPLACAHIADGVAALGLPEPAIAVAGEYGGSQGDLVVLAGDHLFGQSVRAAGLVTPLLSADAPVAVDWSFTDRRLCVNSSQATTLRCAVAAEALVLDGAPVQVPADAYGLVPVELTAGEHLLTGAAPGPERLAALKAGLAERLAGALARRSPTPQALPCVTFPDRPLETIGSARLGSGVVDMVPVPHPDGDLLAVAEKRSVHLLSSEGEERVSVTTEGDVRVLHWWPEEELLLVGCVDEKVLAFGLDGAKRWEFTSDMDPAVYAAAKQYWFKSAHPGIYGLSSGVFMDGKSQAFVGSACTLEILDGAGRLVKRLPVFWGPGWRFTLIDGPGGTRQLLDSRWPNDSVAAAVIDSSTLEVGGGFTSVPDGHANIGGWTAMNRPFTFYTDLDGDGAREVISAINGVWNRVTVWDTAGRARHNVQLGAGEKAPAVTVSGMDVCDIDGDGKQEVLVAKQPARMVMALDSALEKRWAAMLPSEPAALRALPAEGGNAVVVVACADGSVLCLDTAGSPVAAARVEGRPVAAATLGEGTSAAVAIATDAGDVKVLRCGR